MDALHSRGLNVMHGCIWLAIYTRNALMGLVVGGFPGNSSWWTKFGTQAREDRWFRYCVARYAAYNVRWVLYGEVNEAKPSWGTWQAEAARIAAIIRSADPYRHPIGSHHTSVDTSTAGNTNIAYIEIQHGPAYATAIDELSLRGYGKPLWTEEYWYEYSLISELGTRATYENFVKALCYPTFGSWMREHVTATTGAPTYAQQAGKPLFRWLVEDDNGLRRMGKFAAFFRGVNTLDFAPAGSLINRGFCGRFSDAYAVFLPAGGDVTINLTNRAARYDIYRIEIHSGQISSLAAGTGGGSRDLSAGSTNDVAFLFQRRLPPRLGIERANAASVLRWASASSVFRAWSATNLAPPVQWQRLTNLPVADESSQTLVISNLNGNRFFRLSDE